MTDRLYIEEKLMDMLPSERPSFTFQANDFFDISTREASKSNKFRLPKTRGNIENLEMSESVNSATTKPYRKLKCTYIKNGIEIVPEGYAIIEQSDDYYNVTIYSGNINFFSAIEGKYLNDLPLSTWNHLWDLTSIAGFKAATSGLVYPIVAYTDDPAYIGSATNDVDVRRLLPMFFCHTLLRLIVSEAGFTLPSGSFFDTNPFFQKLLLQVGNEKWNTSGMILRAQNTIYQSFTTTGDYLRFDDDSSGSASDFTGNFDIGNTWDNFFGTYKTHFEVQANPFTEGGFDLRLVNVRLTMSTGGSANGCKWILYARVVDAGNNLLRTIRLKEFHVTTPNTSIHEIINVSVPSSQISAGEYVNFAITMHDYTPNADDPRWSFQPGGFVEAEYLSEAPISFGGAVDVALNMPHMTQKDFIKGLVQLMGISFSPDQDGVNLGHKTLVQMALDTAIAPDITEYIDAEDLKNAPVSYRLGKYGQKNWMKYKEDDGNLPGYGDYYFIVFDQTLDKEVTLFTLPFGATMGLTFNTNINIPFIKRWDDDGKLKIKTTPRILLYDDRDIYTDDVNLTDGTSSVLLTSANPIPYAHFIDEAATVNLGFHNSLIKDWYQPLVVMLENAKKITVKGMLPGTFIENMDQLVPVYVKPLHEFFYMNKIVNWDEVGKHGIELIRITGVNGYASVVPRPELIVENEFNSATPWTLVDNTSSGAMAMTGGHIVVTMPAYAPSTAFAIDEWFEQDISGLVPGYSYKLQLMTGNIDPYFNQLRVGPGTPHVELNIGFETPIEFTMPAPLQSNYLYEFIIVPTSASPPDSTLFIQVSVSHDPADAAFSGGEQLKLQWASLKKI